MTLTIGQVVKDEAGESWVYYGYRVTSVHSRSHHFVKCLPGKRELAGLPWVYSATHEETIRHKFPSLAHGDSCHA